MVKTFANGILSQSAIGGAEWPSALSMAIMTGTLGWVLFASKRGLPVSTTHVSSGAIIGMGLRKGPGGINWKTVTERLLAGGVTLPAAGLLAAGCYRLLAVLS